MVISQHQISRRDRVNTDILQFREQRVFGIFAQNTQQFIHGKIFSLSSFHSVRRRRGPSTTNMEGIKRKHLKAWQGGGYLRK